MKKLLLLSIFSVFTYSSCDTAGVLFGEPSEADVLRALQTLLDSSAVDALVTLQSVNEQGIGGLLPEELQPVFQTVGAIAGQEEINRIEGVLQNVSSTALDETGGIMKDAIKSLDFKDAVAVVMGGEDAATQVLREAMYSSVKSRYSSKLSNELMKVDPNIDQYWSTASMAYNLLSREKVDSNLSDFLAERSVDLLFSSIGKNEAEYRNNIPSLGDQVTTRVFDYYRNREKVGDILR